MNSVDRASWQYRYRTALKRCGITFAILAFLFPILMIVIVYALERSGICISPSLRDLSSSCSIFGYEFGDALSELLLPTAFGVVTTGLLVMSGVCTLIYLLWRMTDK